MVSALSQFLPSGSRQVSEITQLRVYPIKSCRGFQIHATKLTRRGLDLDRKWMFVDKHTRKFLTIRDISDMTLVDTALDGKNLKISLKGTGKSISIPAYPTQEWLEKHTTLVPTKVWDSETDGYQYSDEVCNMFTDHFGREVSLILKGPTSRLCGGNGSPKYLGREESTNFSDVLPLQIASESSLVELNGRLKEKGKNQLTIERFRPNIIIKGNLDAWTEDYWKTVRINGSEHMLGLFSDKLPTSAAIDIDVSARCARCQVPNVNPDTAEKDAHEPWDTLTSYRRVDEGMKWKPCFGMLCCPRNEGDIKVGMRFEVLETTDKHYYIKGF